MPVRRLRPAARPGLRGHRGATAHRGPRDPGRRATILVAIAIAGIGGAALLGLLVARSALRPVRRLTATAEEITRTADLTRRIEVTGADELNRLAATVNEMLASLERSVAAQRNLVADASHELRTPLTSIRTNVELLARAEGVDPAEREQMVEDVVAQLEELTGSSATSSSSVANGRARRRHRGRSPGRTRGRLRRTCPAACSARSFDVRPPADARPRVACTLDRAVVNLLDNAVAWGPPDEPIEETVASRVVAVRPRSRHRRRGRGAVIRSLLSLRRATRPPAPARARDRGRSPTPTAARPRSSARDGGGARFRIDLPVEELSATS